MEPKLLNPRVVRRTFDRVASLYDGHAALEQEVASRLLERLEFHRLTPQRIVDLGCGTGQASASLKSRFRKAEVIGLDSSHAMLAQLRRRSGVLRRFEGGVRGYVRIAAGGSILRVAVLQPGDALVPGSGFICLPNFRRVLAPRGDVVIQQFWPGFTEGIESGLGRSGWDSTNMEFVDILQLGDALLAAGFQEPVMDAERITVSYPDIDSLVRELEATGTSGFLQGRTSLAEAKDSLDKAYEPFRIEGRYPVTYEIIYGIAFGPREGQPRKTPQGDVVTFSVESLKKSGRNKG